MAIWILVNTVVLSVGGAQQKFLPGKTLDDTLYTVASIQAAGGEVWPSTDAIVAAAASAVNLAHARRGLNEAEMESRMRAATEASLLASTPYVDAAPLLVPGVSLPTTQQALDSLKRNQVIHLRNQVPAAAGNNPYVVAAALSITLPDNAKAASLVLPSNQGSAWARAGTGTLGKLALIATPADAEPSAGQVSISPSGDIILNHTDAFTLVDVPYMPERQDVVSGTYACTAGTGVVSGLPSGLISVLEAEVLAGGVTGKCIVAAPAATAPTTGLARMTLGKTGVFFCIADAATSVRLKLGVVPAINF